MAADQEASRSPSLYRKVAEDIKAAIAGLSRSANEVGGPLADGQPGG